MTDEELVKLIRSSPWSDGFPYLRETADRIEVLTKALRLAFDAGFDNGWEHARSTSIYDEQPLGCDDAFAEFLKEMEGTEK